MDKDKKEPARNASQSDAGGEKKYPERDEKKREDKVDEGKNEEIDRKKLAEKYLDSWKRCQADFENYKKSQVKWREDFKKYASESIILEILPVLDNFDASLEHIPEAQKKSDWVTGINHIRKQLFDILKSNDIEEIETKIGDKFNPEIHEAVAGKGEKHIISKVVQKGYRLNGRIVRAVKVEVV